MPDTRTWDAGGSDGVWNTVANWTADTEPASGDDVLFNDTADVAVTTAGFQPSFALLFIGDDYTKDIGSVSSVLYTTLLTKIIHRGKGTLYYRHAGPVDDIIVNHTGASRTLALDIINASASGYPKRLIVSRGRVTATNDTNEGGRDLIAVSGRESELTISNTAYLGATNISVVGGKLTLNVTTLDVTDAFVVGGTMDVNGPSVIGTIHIGGGGIVNINGTGIIGTVNVMDGLLDYTKTQIKRTITTVNLWPNGEFKYNPDLTTITNPINEFDGRSVAP